MTRIRTGLSLAICASLALAAPQTASAQLAAALPDKESVERGAPTDADGTYVVSTINKRITIEDGRAYVIDPWNTALIFTVKPGMVTLQNFRQTGPDTFEADDLPMMGKVVFNRQPNGTLQGVVQGAMGEAKYALIPTDYASVAESGGSDYDTRKPSAAQDRVYRLHISGSRCEGKKLLRKNYGGVLSLSMVDAYGNAMQSKNRNFAVKCTDGGPRSQSYKFYEGGPGALTLTVPADARDVKGLVVRTTNKSGLNFKVNRQAGNSLMLAINNAGTLSVGQNLDDQLEVWGDKAKLFVKMTLTRVQ